MFTNIWNKHGQFLEISINAIVEALIFAKIQHREHKITKPRATEWKEIKERLSAKASSHGLFTYIVTCLITCLSDATSFLPMTYPCKNQAGWPFWKGLVIWGQGGWTWHAPAKINWGGHSGKSQVKRLAFRTQLVYLFWSYSSIFHIQGAQTSVKHFQWFHDQWHINWCREWQQVIAAVLQTPRKMSALHTCVGLLSFGVVEFWPLIKEIRSALSG